MFKINAARKYIIIGWDLHLRGWAQKSEDITYVIEVRATMTIPNWNEVLETKLYENSFTKTWAIGYLLI